LDERGDHPGRVGARIGVHHRRGVEAADPPRRLDLPREPLAELLAAGVPGMDNLHRDLAAAGRQAQEHLTHAAFTEPPDQSVVTYPVRITGLEMLHNPSPTHPIRYQTDPGPYQ